MAILRELVKRASYRIGHPIIRFFWRTARPATVGARAIVVFENEILLVRNIGVSYWSLPGGRGGSKEKPEACLARELKEELLLDPIRIEYKLGTYRSEHEGKRDTVHVFVVSLPSFFHKRQWEIDEARWFELAHLPDNLSPATKRRIGEYQSGKRNVSEDW